MEGQLPDGRSARSHGLTLLPRQAAPLVDDPPTASTQQGTSQLWFSKPQSSKVGSNWNSKRYRKEEKPAWMERLLCAELELRPSDVR